MSTFGFWNKEAQQALAADLANAGLDNNKYESLEWKWERCNWKEWLSYLQLAISTTYDGFASRCRGI